MRVALTVLVLAVGIVALLAALRNPRTRVGRVAWVVAIVLALGLATSWTLFLTLG